MTKDEIKQKKIAYISLGCDKNRVDLEKMLYEIEKFGIKHTNNISEANIVIINSCAFILPARKEAIDNIFSVAKLKENGVLEKIVVTGCLPQRYLKELKEELPEVDKFVPVKDNNKIIEIIGELYNIGIDSKATYKSQYLTTPSHYAYLKISDGCSNGCAYCTIPLIRGRYISVPFEEVIRQANELAKNGVKELIIVAQDVTRYGIDLYKKHRLVELITEISKIKGIEWIRLHYLYPELVTDELLELTAKNPKVCKYLDIPFQHIDDEILKKMNRKSSEEQIRQLTKKISEKYPEIAIRSTFIVGFPGETKKQFKKLCNFLQETKLNNVGFFPYYREEGTKAFFMNKQKSNFIKNIRLKKAQKVQTKVANEINNSRIGQAYRVLIDSFDETTGNYLGRTQFNSPNVDYYVIINFVNELVIGAFYEANITDFKNFVFIGEVK